jgi:DNA-binding CsgD family transcriptional regulator
MPEPGARSPLNWRRALPDSTMLSPREREIVILLGNGSDRTYRDVATMLGIRLSTVRSHVDRIMARNPSSKRPRAAIRDLYIMVASAPGVSAP